MVLVAGVAAELEARRDVQTAACVLSVLLPGLIASFGLPPGSAQQVPSLKAKKGGSWSAPKLPAAGALMRPSAVELLRRFLGRQDVAWFDQAVVSYSEFLFGWGMYSQRAHLVEVLRPEGGWMQQWVAQSSLPIAVKSSALPSPAAGAKAGGALKKVPGQQGGRVVCGLCRLTVKGVAVICPKCGHGGHLEHMRAWYSLNARCPTGCECNCTAGEDEYWPGGAGEATGKMSCAG